MADYSNYKLSNTEIFLICLISILGMGLIGKLFFGNWFAGVVGLIAMKKIVSLYKEYKIAERKRTILCQFKDCLYSFSSSFFSGRHMKEAIYEAKLYILQIYGEQSPLAKELDNMYNSIEKVKEDDCKLWIDFGDRVKIEDIQDFATIYSTCRETGGNLTEVVNRASKIIGDKIETEEEIKSSLSQRKLEGRMIAAMPIAILLFLNLTAPDYIRIMYTTVLGHILMAIVIGIMILGIYIIERIVRIEI